MMLWFSTAVYDCWVRCFFLEGHGVHGDWLGIPFARSFAFVHRDFRFDCFTYAVLWAGGQCKGCAAVQANKCFSSFDHYHGGSTLRKSAASSN
jgi:hypothetical protein